MWPPPITQQYKLESPKTMDMCWAAVFSGMLLVSEKFAGMGGGERLSSGSGGWKIVIGGGGGEGLFQGRGE